jgi:hypothetical protein
MALAPNRPDRLADVLTCHETLADLSAPERLGWRWRFWINRSAKPLLATWQMSGVHLGDYRLRTCLPPECFPVDMSFGRRLPRDPCLPRIGSAFVPCRGRPHTQMAPRASNIYKSRRWRFVFPLAVNSRLGARF